MITARFMVFLLLFLLLPAAFAAKLPGIPGFINEMVAKHHFKRSELQRLFQRAQYRQSIIDAITTPATTKPWPEYRAIFVNQKRIRAGLEFWKHYRHTLRRAEKKYGVPQEIIVALIGVETLYGKHTGTFRAIDALTTLAFKYPQRAAFFRSELEQYLLLARDQDFNLLGVQGSYAGALGIPQFMPSSYRKYAVDFDHDGKIDLMNDPVDAIGSVANYLKQFGWTRGQPVAVRSKVSDTAKIADQTGKRKASAWTAAGVVPERDVMGDAKARLIDFTMPEGKEFWLAFDNFQVITRYNNSDFYAMSVYQLAEALDRARHPVTAG
jgi:membrane-bound lytic murein transglycosylase B